VDSVPAAGSRTSVK